MIWTSLNEKKTEKRKPVANTWYDQLINYVPNPIRQTLGGFKDEVVSLFKTNTPKDYGKQIVYVRRMKPINLNTQSF